MKEIDKETLPGEGGRLDEQMVSVASTAQAKSKSPLDNLRSLCELMAERYDTHQVFRDVAFDELFDFLLKQGRARIGKHAWPSNVYSEGKTTGAETSYSMEISIHWFNLTLTWQRMHLNTMGCVIINLLSVVRLREPAPKPV